MTAKYKRTYRIYSAWNYQKEIEDLDRASEQGWQLVRGGCFHSRFVNRPDIRYRYQMDFRKIEDMGRYIETFREQGWEYVNSTFNGWHYFRKLYDPELPEEAYEIFTDRDSLHEMNSRWARIALIVSTVLGAFALFYAVWMIKKPTLPSLVQFLTLAVESAVLLRGGLLMRNPDASRSRRGDSAFLAVFLAVILVGAAASITLTQLRPSFSTEQQAGSIDAPIVDSRWQDFETLYPDSYYLDLELQAEEPLTFAVLNEEGEAVYTKTSTDYRQDGIRLKLPRGQYRLSMSCSTGFHVRCAVS